MNKIVAFILFAVGATMLVPFIGVLWYFVPYMLFLTEYPLGSEASAGAVALAVLGSGLLIAAAAVWED